METPFLSRFMYNNNCRHQVFKVLLVVFSFIRLLWIGIPDAKNYKPFGNGKKGEETAL